MDDERDDSDRRSVLDLSLREMIEELDQWEAFRTVDPAVGEVFVSISRERPTAWEGAKVPTVDWVTGVLSGDR